MTSKWDLWGWWSAYGESAPQLKAIGQQLTGMEPSSCPVERSFSLQKSVRSLVRNILTHEKVSKLILYTPTSTLRVATTSRPSISSFSSRL